MNGGLLEELAQATDGLVTALLLGDVSRLEAAFATHEGCLRRLEGAAGLSGPGGPPRPTWHPSPEEAARIGQIRTDLGRARLLVRQGLAIARRRAGTGPEATYQRPGGVRP